VSAAVDPVPPAAREPFATWCTARPPFAEYVICKRLAGHSGLHRSDGRPDWADEPTPTTSEENTNA